MVDLVKKAVHKVKSGTQRAQRRRREHREEAKNIRGDLCVSSVFSVFAKRAQSANLLFDLP
jgi:hypothetical protein